VPGAIFKLNFPSKSVIVPMVVPSAKMVTPGSDSPVASSNTVPRIIPDWAMDSSDKKRKRMTMDIFLIKNMCGI
jgi:hypothetical protein